MGWKGTLPSRVWDVVGLGCCLWRVERRVGGTSGGGVVARGERRWCLNGEGWRVGIRVVAGGGTPGDRGVPCGQGLGGVGTGVWRSGAQMVRAVGGGVWRLEG
jgi:hypothetical protein